MPASVKMPVHSDLTSKGPGKGDTKYPLECQATYTKLLQLLAFFRWWPFKSVINDTALPICTQLRPVNWIRTDKIVYITDDINIMDKTVVKLLS